MRGVPELVGRAREREQLGAACRDALTGRGGVVLVSGDSGIGKTRLVHEVAAGCGLRILAATAVDRSAAYGPVARILRLWLRQPDGDIRSCGPLAPHLALLLPELGTPPDDGVDRTTLVEALRCAIDSIAAQRPTAIVLDDLQHADDATLEALPALAAALPGTGLLVVGIYRSDEIGSDHPVRRLRSTLRRDGTGRELHVEPLDAAGIAALVGSVLGGPPAPALVAMIGGRAEGVPFFAEELTAALQVAGRLVDTPEGIALAAGGDVPLPATIRDAVMVRTDGMSPPSRDALEIAAVAGGRFDFRLVADLSTRGTLDEAIERGLVVEYEPGQGGFRHALVREAVYGGVPWTRRRALHRRIAQRLDADGAPAGLLAQHWIAAREPARARAALQAAAKAARRLHAHKDAMRTGLQALELWPDGAQEADRIAVLVDVAECAQLCGELGDAARAWREVVERMRRCGDVGGVARAQRRLAGVYTLEGSSQRALDAWLAAAVAFAACGMRDDAAQSRLAAATLLQYAGRLGGALEALAAAAADVECSARTDMQLRARTLEGVTRGKLGQTDVALELVREALSRSLRDGLVAAAADAYSALAVVFENAADYAGARDAYTTAIDFCDARGIEGAAQVCMGCLAHLVRQTGDWRRATALCTSVLTTTSHGRPDPAMAAARYAAQAVLAMLHTCRGALRPARGMLTEAASAFGALGLIGPDFEYLGARARLAELETATSSAAVDACIEMLDRFDTTDDIHYSVQHLRWASGAFARAGRITEGRRCAEALGRVAAAAPNPETFAALAVALGDVALVEGDANHADMHFDRALQLMRGLPLPLDRAEILLRAGAAAVASGNTAGATRRFTDAYLSARRLGARPLAAAAHAELIRHGAQVERRRRRVRSEVENAELTPREIDVVRLVAGGRTNREIATELFLSHRTVDMHVRNALARLDCRSRADAVRRAAELGLLSRAR